MCVLECFPLKAVREPLVGLGHLALAKKSRQHTTDDNGR